MSRVSTCREPNGTSRPNEVAGVRRPARLAGRTSGFTLVELLVVTLIIMLLAGLMLSALAGALEEARVQRTQGQIAKINQVILAKYEGFRTRRVMVAYNPNFTLMAQARLDAIRALIRAELPDRISDIDDNPADAGPPTWYVANDPTRVYSQPLFRRVHAIRTATGKTWTAQYEGSECLYLILSMPQEDGRYPLEFFKESEIGDVDNDGMKEILDGWGNPIEFLRWAPGFESPLQPPVASGYTRIDPFDPYYTRTAKPNNPALSYPLVPLVYSAGADGAYDTQAGVSAGVPVYATTSPPNDPFTGGGIIGTRSDSNGNGKQEWSDNLHNHNLDGS